MFSHSYPTKHFSSYIHQTQLKKNLKEHDDIRVIETRLVNCNNIIGIQYTWVTTTYYNNKHHNILCVCRLASM